MVYKYKTNGTCSSSIDIEIGDDGIIADVAFHGGCNGNTKGIAALVRGMKADEVSEKLEGIRCGFKQTSCPDQLAKALRAIAKEK